jgi:DNA-binding NtrC family response regulator
MRALVHTIRRIGPQDLSVLIRGPTGSGKDLVAQALHDASTRRSELFTAIHVPSLQPELLEAELFGHVQGAFTGAERDRAGLLANAQKGTVYFDEVASLGLPAQAKLLRVLDRREVRPLGGTELFALDVRFLFSTVKDLRLLISQGRFREDLYWRIAQAEVVVPPLSERHDDLPELVSLLLRKHARLGRPLPDLDPAVVAFLRTRLWPGNVRQLETVLLRALLASGRDRPLTVDLLRRVLSSSRHAGPIPEDLLDSEDLDSLRRDVEIAWLRRQFFKVGGSMSALARKLSMSRPSLYEWLKRLPCPQALNESTQPVRVVEASRREARSVARGDAAAGRGRA